MKNGKNGATIMQIITEKKDLSDDQKVELFLNCILLNMGSVGLLAVDREHPDLKFYITSALLLAQFAGDRETIEELQMELLKIDKT